MLSNCHLESYCLDYEIDYSGAVLEMVPWTPSTTHCQFECQKRTQCQFFTFDASSGNCYLKTTQGPIGPHPNAISGPKFCATKKGLPRFSHLNQKKI